MRDRRISLFVFLIVALAAAGCGRKPAPVAEPTDVPLSADETNPLAAGTLVPDVKLTDVEGREVALAALVKQKPAVIIFYRGGWCPYCTAHLGELKKVEVQLLALGYQILAVGMDRPEVLRETAAQLDTEYRLLSDSKAEAARAFGLAFKVDDATNEKYKEYGIDLEGASGETHHILPVPAVYVVDTDGVIRFAHANPDYKDRLSPDDVLEAARRAAP